MKHDRSSKFTFIDSPVSDAVILICDKCGKKLESDFDENPSRRLQKEIKSEIKSTIGKERVRAVLTSCLDVCPKNEIAIGISFTKFNSQESHFMTLKPNDPEDDAKNLVDQIAPLL
jgi:predicted metal-binding protein